MNEMPRREINRRARMDQLLGAALKVFARDGFSGASMEAVAAAAGTSKPTLYKYFESKEALFAAVMAARRDDMLMAFEEDEPAQMVAQLHRFAWTYTQTVMRPDMLSLARLIIGEAQRFPDIGRAYQQDGPDHVLQGMMAYLSTQRDAGRLLFHDAELAAQDLWGLILSAPRTKALHEPDWTPTRADLARYVDNGLRVFLRAYSTTPQDDLATLETLSRPGRTAS
jgi:AcrR family transcriptional regulator